MIITIVDVETDGVHDGCIALEYAIANYDIESRSIINSASTIVRTTSPSLDTIESTQKLTGINPELIKACNNQAKLIYSNICDFFESSFVHSDIVMAYNAEFDKQFFTRPAKWLCAYRDIDWIMDNEFAKPSTLVNLAVSYGIPVNAAHRAMADVMLLARVLSASNNLDELIIDALEPKYRVVASVSYNRKEEAKALGFKWDGQLKQWWRYANERQIEDYRTKGVEVELIGDGNF